MVQPWILTSPASRGIGLALTRHLLRTTTLPIITTARADLQGTKKRMLEGLDVDPSRLQVLELDVTDESSIAAAASQCSTLFTQKSSYLHLAFCIPGILHPEKSPSAISYDDALQTLKINTLGPMMLMKHFAPFLPRKSTTLASLPSSSPLPQTPTFAMMSARVGSITDNAMGGWYSYRASKAGVNQLVKSLDIYLKNTAGGNAMAVGLHPGTVKTDLSKEFWASTKKEKLFEADWVAERLCEVVKEVGVEGRGKCWDWAGKEISP